MKVWKALVLELCIIVSSFAAGWMSRGCEQKHLDPRQCDPPPGHVYIWKGPNVWMSANARLFDGPQCYEQEKGM